MFKIGDRVIWTQDVGYFHPLLAFEQQELPAVIIGFTKKRIKIKVTWESGDNVVENIHTVSARRLRIATEEENRSLFFPSGDTKI